MRFLAHRRRHPPGASGSTRKVDRVIDLLQLSSEHHAAAGPIRDRGQQVHPRLRRGVRRRLSTDHPRPLGQEAVRVGGDQGGLGVLFAAARRPEATLSLALLEPGAFALGQHHPAGRALVDRVRRMWDQDIPDEPWVTGFLKAVGSDPDEFPRTSSPLHFRSCRFSAAAGRSGTPTCHSGSWRRRHSPSSSCPAGTAPGSTPSATTSPSGSAPPGRWSRRRPRDPVRRHTHQ